MTSSQRERAGTQVVTEVPITVERAYRVLNVAPDASALTIKQAYRKLVKRWHPDLQQPGTRAHAESTEMGRILNEAYALIQHAPLRYQKATRAANYRPPETRAADAAWEQIMFRQALRSDMNTPPRMDRVEYWVRFGCGAILGCFIAFAVSLDVLSYPTTHRAYPDAIMIPIFLGIVVLCGSGSARYGDRFWYFMFRARDL